MLYADTALGEEAPTRCGHAFFGTGHCLFATDAPFDAEQGRGLIANTLACGRGARDFGRRSASDSSSGNARALLRL